MRFRFEANKRSAWFAFISLALFALADFTHKPSECILGALWFLIVAVVQCDIVADGLPVKVVNNTNIVAPNATVIEKIVEKETEE